jgi:hypothetical protein
MAVSSENPSFQESSSSSFLTMDFFETPPDEPTPRINNVSSVSSSSSSSSSSSLLLTPFKKKTKKNDGVQILAWAAKAVESPLFNGDKKRSHVLCLLAEAIDHSPIIIPPHQQKGNITRTSGFAIAGGPTTAAASLEETFNSCVVPAAPDLTTLNNSNNNGSTPIFFNRYHHHHTAEVDLELLRECLDNVFSGSSSSSTLSSSLPLQSSSENVAYAGYDAQQLHQTGAIW